MALLLEHGADLFAQTEDGETAYDMAAQALHLSTCDMLVTAATNASALRQAR